MADVTVLPVRAPEVDHRQLALRLRLAALEGERRAVAAARQLPEIDADIEAVRRRLEENR